MDNRWLERCREGDALAIERFVQTYQQDVYRMALSILDDPDDADDAMQEAFLSALRGLATFRENASLKTWLFRITINICRSRLKRQKSRSRLQQILQSLFHLRGEQAQPEDEAMKNQADAALWKAIHSLDGKHRIPIVLRYYHDLPVAEIATMLGVPTGTVHSRLNHAREQLRIQLKEEQR